MRGATGEEGGSIGKGTHGSFNYGCKQQVVKKEARWEAL